MTGPGSPDHDPGRLESLWHDDFGAEYIERNRAVTEGREPLWRWLHEHHPFASVLEVGCNIGGNLHWLRRLLEPRAVYGVDINEKALAEVRTSMPDVNAVFSPARSLPFRDAAFDLVFTTGVLIHQSPDSLPIVMNEIVRCSRRYVMCGEYHADEPEEVPYRGQRGALFRRDWGGYYQALFPQLSLVHSRFEAWETSGWDDMTFSLFEKDVRS
jgi:spore coat polysaccharide biosynthesis protein SpsF